jgi:uncharacterized membrane protein
VKLPKITQKPPILGRIFHNTSSIPDIHQNNWGKCLVSALSRRGNFKEREEMNTKLDAKDRQILQALQRNGRITNHALAEEVNLSPSPCLRRLRILEERGVIRGYSADIDPKQYGLSMMAFISIRLEGEPPHLRSSI